MAGELASILREILATNKEFLKTEKQVFTSLQNMNRIRELASLAMKNMGVAQGLRTGAAVAGSVISAVMQSPRTLFENIFSSARNIDRFRNNLGYANSPMGMNGGGAYSLSGQQTINEATKGPKESLWQRIKSGVSTAMAASRAAGGGSGGGGSAAGAAAASSAMSGEAAGAGAATAGAGGAAGKMGLAGTVAAGALWAAKQVHKSMWAGNSSYNDPVTSYNEQLTDASNSVKDTSTWTTGWAATWGISALTKGVGTF